MLFSDLYSPQSRVRSSEGRRFVLWQSWNLLQWAMGNSLRQCLGYLWRSRGLQTAWILKAGFQCLHWRPLWPRDRTYLDGWRGVFRQWISSLRLQTTWMGPACLHSQQRLECVLSIRLRLPSFGWWWLLLWPCWSIPQWDMGHSVRWWLGYQRSPRSVSPAWIRQRIFCSLLCNIRPGVWSNFLRRCWLLRRRSIAVWLQSPWLGKAQLWSPWRCKCDLRYQLIWNTFAGSLSFSPIFLPILNYVTVNRCIDNI